MHSYSESRRFAGRSRPDPVAEAAAEWVARCDRGLSEGEARALSEWQAADPRHASEYARLRRGWGSLDGIGADPSLARMADVAQAGAESRRARLRFRAIASGLAAAAAAVVLMLTWRHPAAGRPEAGLPAKDYIVLGSAAPLTALPDGSVAKLNGASRIEAHFTDAARRVRLIQGEAYFEVAKNPARPFVVSAGWVTVRAVGTAFDVRLAPEAVEVVVTEGTVRLAASSDPNGTSVPTQTLTAGQRAVYRTVANKKVPVAIDTPAPAVIDQALAWESPRLVFERTPLDQVVAAFNRYNAHKLVLADPALRGRTLTGVFRADNLDGFVRLLRASVDVLAEPDGKIRPLRGSAP